MKIITWNVNGIRAVERKGELQNLVARQPPDVLMLQEIKGTTDQFSGFLTAHPDYHQHYHSAEKKGYAGTSIWMAKPVSGALGGKFARGEAYINGIEGFWGCAKSRLAKFRGMSKRAFYLHLKEREFRLNHRHEEEYEILLDSCWKMPIKLS